MKKGQRLYRIKLTPEERQQLLELEKTTANKKPYKRILAIKMLDENKKNKEVAESLSICIDTITDWVEIYRKDGIEGLVNFQYKGRPSKLSAEQISKIKEEVNKGSFAVAADIQHYIAENFGVEYSVKYISELAKKIGLSYKKTKSIPGKAPSINTQKKRYMK